MLVLSRRPKQSICFPNLGITIQVAQVRGSIVRIGIDAPPDIAVVREELLNETPAAKVPPQPNWSHVCRNRLNTATIALSVAEKQVQAGLADEARASLNEAMRALESLDEQMNGSQPKPVLPRAFRTLVVEDDANEKSLLSSYLQLSGQQVESVQDGQEALDFLARHERPDFLLMDMHLPRLDGPATIAAIRRNPQFEGLRIFAVTGSSRGEFNIPSAAIDGWFQKPINPARLVDSMSRMSGRPPAEPMVGAIA